MNICIILFSIIETMSQPLATEVTTEQPATAAIDINVMDELQALRNRVAELESHSRRRSIIDEPAECDICHKMFKNKYILKTHKANIHNSERQRYECHICHKSFASKYYLARHINAKHPATDDNAIALDDLDDIIFTQ